MPTICSSANLVYYSVPKVACTSLKVMFYQLNNSVEWRGTRLAFGQVHTLPGYGNAPYHESFIDSFKGYKPITVVRNPIARALSAYRDKAREIVLTGTKAEVRLKMAGLPLEPDPELFFNEIEQYFECAPLIREHMRPFSYYLGDDLGFFERVFRLEALEELSAFVSEQTGKNVPLIASNSSEKSVNAPKPISDKTLQMVADFVSEDFEYLADYYP